MSFNKIELLAPAGTPDALNAAIGEGADAVYFGFKDFNARQRAKNFSYRETEVIIEKFKQISKKAYITLNTIFEDWETDRVYNLLKYLSLVKPDAVIVQDFGIINIINKYFNNLKIHASTQMNVSSSNGVNFLSKYNVNRVVLSRELSFDEIKEIRNNTVSELEVFVHGALCISASGLCLFSSYTDRKSANRGYCVQSCRKIYKSGKKNGPYFSTNDLMLIRQLPHLMDIGINSIKIEGRMRSANYVAQTVKAYRYVIDNYRNEGEDAINKGISILNDDMARNKTTYLFQNKNNTDHLMTKQKSGTGIYLGIVNKIKKINNDFYFSIKNSSASCSINDILRTQSIDGKKRKSFKIKQIIKNDNNIFIKSDFKLDINDAIYLISRAEQKAKYSHVIPKNLKNYKRHPGNKLAPFLKISKKNKSNDYKLKNGIYVKLSFFKDIFLIQAIKPDKIILTLTVKNYEELKWNINKITFKKEDIIINFEPFFQQSDVEDLKRKIEFLLKNNFKDFILNNLGQVNLLIDKKVNLIAGPYLYSFNRYSIDFLLNCGFNYIVSPIENNKKNLFDSTKFFSKQNWIVTIFSFPELFYIISKINKNFDFNEITDNKNNLFNIVKFDEKLTVIPEKPFSIIDKIPLLKKHGIEKLIVDFSNIQLKKNYYKNILNSVFKYEILQNTTRFNWNDGFYRFK
ncbi:MAG: U32 family peptidase [Spirochaetes bacterium]|nr:U32 family peptidase [Spirochaetota bacterium]